MLKKQEQRLRRHKRLRARISGSLEKPRLCVFRSAKHIQAQLIDDAARKTLVSASDQEMKTHKAKEGMNKKVSSAFEVGKLLAKKALEKKIEKVVFDRGGYKYQGRVKALADGAREAGLKF